MIVEGGIGKYAVFNVYGIHLAQAILKGRHIKLVFMYNAFDLVYIEVKDIK